MCVYCEVSILLGDIMKVYISVDIEGVAGITHWDEAEKAHPDYPEFREQMTREAVAAIEGAQAAGANWQLRPQRPECGRQQHR
jgi:D-amino peptidase